MMIQGDDGYDEMSAWATHGVCQRLSLVCAATFGGLNGFSLVCAATFGGPMMVTVKCLLGQLMVFVTGYHWIVRLQLVGHLDISQ